MGSNGVAEVVYRLWQCTYCSHEYDEALGDPDSGIAPGTRFEDLPEDWICPDCAQPKSAFTLVE